ncbi:MAG: arsenate reductase family protein [Hyphomicrobiales bacterium]
MKLKAYILGTCSTCQRIMKDINWDNKDNVQDIKTDKITAPQLEEMHKMAGSYEKLFSRRAMKYKELDLKNKNLAEEDYKRYILEEYTFLKRPVFIINDSIYIGNSKKTVEQVKEQLEKLK